MRMLEAEKFSHKTKMDGPGNYQNASTDREFPVP